MQDVRQQERPEKAYVYFCVGICDGFRDDSYFRFLYTEERRKEMEEVVRFEGFLRRKAEKRVKGKQNGSFEEKMEFLRGHEEDDSVSVLLCEISRLKEAAENYRLAPMNIKRYYIAMSDNLMKKYGAELAAHDPELKEESEIGDISLYQNAEYYLIRLRDALTDITVSRADTKEVKGA